MKTTGYPGALIRALAVVAAGLLAAGCANAVTLTIADTSVSETSTRDGRTLTLGYRISSDGATTAQLAASLTGPTTSTDTVTDMMPSGLTIDVTAGTDWYYRVFPINLGPGASQGSTKYYSVKYTVNWGPGQTTSLTRTNILTMQSPISVRIPCLMYHKVGDALYSQYWNTTDMLRAQMAQLKAYGYTSVTCRELMNYRAGIDTPPAKPVMITFDGGYQNFYTDALPIISSFGYKPVVFLLTGVMGQDNSWDGDNNPVIMFMTWDEVALCYGSYNTEYIDLQSHTVTHPHMATSSPSTNNYELTHSRELIQQYFPDDPVDFFCYPYGEYNTTVKTACRNNYYFAAWAAWGGVDANCTDKWAIKRVPIYSDVVTDWDPGKPSSFFLNKIGEGIVIPSITINSVQFIDPATGNPVVNDELKWGQTVKVRVVATNGGSAADVTASLTLDNDSDPSNGVVYDSHAATPSQDYSLTGWTGESTFEWLWTAPVDAPTSQYIATIYFKDKYSVAGFLHTGYMAFTVKSDLANLGNAKTLWDNTWAAFKGAAVTAAWPDCFYIETDSRAMGIRVEKAGHGISAGARVDVAGQIITNASGERCLAAGYASANGTAAVRPVALTNRAIGGGAFGRQNAVGAWQNGQWVQASGLNNIGLLVRAWGKVKSIDTTNRIIVIDDGSGVDVKCAWSSGVTVHPGWTHVTVTAISSCETIGGQLARLVLIVSAQSGS